MADTSSVQGIMRGTIDSYADDGGAVAAPLGALLHPVSMPACRIRPWPRLVTYALCPADRLCYLWRTMSASEPTILHEDNHLLAVVKPAGLLVQGDRSGDPTLLEVCKAYLKAKYDKQGNVYLGLVHRLDRPVSGVVLLARTSKAASRLSAQFRARSVRKTYLAVVEGAPPALRGTLAHHLADRADAQGRTRCADALFTGSREGRLDYRVLSADPRRSVLLVEPATGRRHQIRAQLAAAGCPVAGDLKYGAPVGLPDRSIALHAWRLQCAHPVGGAPVSFEAPPPRHEPWPKTWPEPSGDPGP